ncbi:MAG: aldose 1-epimerase family protein [Bacteroidia bacterium]|nr:aldose 1-epimerase family protein [Bacteroidia bacterium]
MENKLTISSENFEASILSFGAELCSVKNIQSNHEYIWQADKTIWGRHAPVLFPFVGRLKNFEYLYNGKKYEIEQHGFARDLQFELISIEDDCAEFELKKNDYTFSRYPFDFSLRVKYKIVKNQLEMIFEICNNNNCEMPVSFGAHPAFSIISADDSLIEFENDQYAESWLLEDNFISSNKEKVADSSGFILVNKHTFDKDAMIFKNLKSSWVNLKSKSTNRYVKVYIENWKYLGIWAKPNSRFICIEPWEGLADSVNFNRDVFEKEGIILMKPYQNLKKSFIMEFGY